MNPVDEARPSLSQSDLDRALLDNFNTPVLPDSNRPTFIDNGFDPSSTGATTSVSITYASRLGIDRTAVQEADIAAQYRAQQQEVPPVTAADTNLQDEKTALILDLTQMALDIAGIVDPTPISDGISGVMSLFRGDWLGAGISVAAMIPYVGDLAKAGKLPKLLRTVERAVEIASKDAKFAETLRPVLEKLKVALDAIPIDSLPGAIREPLQAMKNKIDEFFSASRRNEPYVGEVRGQRVELPGVHTENFVYLKRDRASYSQLRRDFDNHGRADFLRRLGAEQEQQLRAAGFNDADIALIQRGRVPEGYQVHHKKPLDDGGDNSFDNLVLIRNAPYHQAITNAQQRLVGDLQPGQSRTVDFPIPEGSIYPPTPIP
jgi:uncharacterized protein